MVGMERMATIGLVASSIINFLLLSTTSASFLACLGSLGGIAGITGKTKRLLCKQPVWYGSHWNGASAPQ